MLNTVIDTNTHSVYYSLNVLFIGVNMEISKDKEVIQALGGSTKIAVLLGFKKQRVQNWTVRGIPSDVKLKYPHLFLNPNINKGGDSAA